MMGEQSRNSNVDANTEAADARLSDFRQRLRVLQRAQILYPTSLPVKRWAPFVIAAMLLFVSASALRTPRSPIDGDELLTRAARASSSVEQTTVRIRFAPPTGFARAHDAFAPFTFTLDGRGDDRAIVKDALHGDAAILLALVEQFGLDLDHPLRVESLRTWRAQARARSRELRDSVTFDGKSTWLLRTQVRDSPIRVIEVAADWDSYRIVRITFIAEGLGRVDAERVAR